MRSASACSPHGSRDEDALGRPELSVFAQRALKSSGLHDASISPAAPPITAIVDDDPSVRRALQRVVRRLHGEELRNGPRISRRVAALLLGLPRLNIYLGGMSSFILITAHDDAPTRAGIAQSGAAGHLLKPFDGPASLDAIGRAIGRG